MGAFGGKRRYMEQVAPSGSIYQAGTLSGNPLAMAAGLATLRKLKNMDYDDLASRTADFARELAEILRGKGLTVQMPQIASMFCPFFTAEPVMNFEKAKKSDQELFGSFFRQMRQHGVFLAPSGFETGFVSFAHTAEDFGRALDAAREISLTA